MSEAITQEALPAATPAETNDAAPPANNTSEQQAPPAPKEDDFSYVPAKFRNSEGKPDFKKMADSYAGLEKKLSTKPNIPASKIDEYEWQAPEDFGIELDAEQVTKFKEEALAQGMTPKQYEFLMTRYGEIVKGMTAQLGLDTEASSTALKEAWGKDYDRQMQVAKAAFDEYASSDSDINNPIWNHPDVLKFMARVGAELGEDSLIGNKQAASNQAMTPDEVRSILSSEKYRMGDRELHAKVTEWFQKGGRV